MVAGLPAAPAATAADSIVIHTRSDRMTLRMAKAPQVYLAGRFDAGAVAQVQQLLQAGRLIPGTDVYLDSSSGDLSSGMALGQLFRSARVNTHLGAWRDSARKGTPARPASCVDACAYAFLGGIYRWSPSGGDRIGLSEAPPPVADEPMSPALRDYLDAMDVPPASLAKVQGAVQGGVAWWKADAMAPWRVANNGRLPLAASYLPAPEAPQLLLSQTVRGSQNQLALQCTADRVDVTAHYIVGDTRASQLAARATEAYFEIDQKVWAPRQGERPQAEGDTLSFTRPLPFKQLEALLHTQSLAAQIEIAGSPVRLGFWLAPSVAGKPAQAFYRACLALQPERVRQQYETKPVKRSLWQRIRDGLRHR